jgi:NADPH:quinone reductase-like Zn-dependent oxidoreductase
VLIIGASGGVGTYAVQLAKALEAEVIAVCSTAKADMVALSAPTTSSTTGVRTLRRRSTTTTSSLTSAGTRPCHACGAPSLRRGSLSSPRRDRWAPALARGLRSQIRARLLSPFVGQTLTTFISSENYDDMIELKNFIEAGTVSPVIDRTFPLSEVPEAIRYLRDGRARGKVVITV